MVKRLIIYSLWVNSNKRKKPTLFCDPTTQKISLFSTLCNTLLDTKTQKVWFLLQSLRLVSGYPNSCPTRHARIWNLIGLVKSRLIKQIQEGKVKRGRAHMWWVKSHTQCQHQANTMAMDFLTNHKCYLTTRILWCKLGLMMRLAMFIHRLSYHSWEISHILEN